MEPKPIVEFLGILLMNSCNTDIYIYIFFSNYYHLQSVRFEFIHKMSSNTRTRVFLYTQFLLNQSDWSQLSYWGLVSLSISLFPSHEFL